MEEQERREHLKVIRDGQEDLGNALVRTLAELGILREVRPGLYVGPKPEELRDEEACWRGPEPREGESDV